jgi:signal transduction histidine kinase
LLEREVDNQNVAAILSQSETLVGLVDRTQGVIAALDEGDGVTVRSMTLSPVVSDRVEAIQESYPTVTISASVPEGTTVLADDLLSDVLGNVISNAIEHNPAEERDVDVVATETADTVQIRVADNGPGIPDAQKGQVFTRGVTGEGSDGGFGLFFVETMVDAYGGRVWVTDSDSGGAEVVIELQHGARGMWDE